MTLRNVKLILAREIRDQLRDRRTLFVILVLPVLLYPLLGMSFFQVMQFMRQQPSRVLVSGVSGRDVPSALFEGERFAAGLFSGPEQADLLTVRRESEPLPSGNEADRDPRGSARRQVQSGACDAVLYFPPGFAERLQDLRQAIRQHTLTTDRADTPHSAFRIPHSSETAVPQPEIIYSTANEKSKIAAMRLTAVIRRWTELLGKENLEASGIPLAAARPFDFKEADVAESTGLRNAAVWARMLPVMLLLWALTGAFYPAVDLCAGEKERGTLETLLSSPAGRGEIVLGKLLTVMLFSIVSAVLNLASIGLTAWLIVRGLPGFGPPPPLAWLWLLLALLPISALFSALCLALAAFARSTKEGQYYLMPLLMVTLPLVVIPMSPGVELNLGNSLIPVTGAVLLLRTLLEGNYLAVLPYLPVVLGVTLLACLMAIRWAVDQFNSETVLFRESERFSPGVWMKHFLRERRATPTAAAALSCGLLILLVHFFLSLILSSSPELFFTDAVVTQVAAILLPALLMTALAARSPRQTLQLRLPSWKTAVAACVLAVVLHPLAQLLQMLVTALYPVSPDVASQMKTYQDLFTAAPFGTLVLVIALTPALCEELAFRGFLLSGFRRLGYKWRAIALSALFFAVTHGILQQSLIAFLMGLVVGYVVVQSGSILPGMIFHFTHNLLIVANPRITPELCVQQPWLRMFVGSTGAQGTQYHWQLWALGAILGALILAWFQRLPYPKTPEEQLREAVRHGGQIPPGEDEIGIRLVQMLK
jgi:sodium transport system permease protein